MNKIFLDANVFFAAAGSPTGGSGFILELAKRKKLEIITVNQALLEAERNIFKKLGPRYLNRHYQNLLAIKPEIQSIEFITLREVTKLQKIIPTKDIPILLGTILSKSPFLITLDRKHFLENKKLKKIKLSFKMLNPGEFLRDYLK